MSKEKKSHEILKSIIVFACLAVIGGLVVGGIHYYKKLHSIQEQTFVSKFNNIQRGDTAEKVKKSLGSPDTVIKYNIEPGDIKLDLPSEQWVYNVLKGSYRIMFEPPGLLHLDDSMKWQVVTKTDSI